MLALTHTIRTYIAYLLCCLVLMTQVVTIPCLSKQDAMMLKYNALDSVSAMACSS